ncbi:MAG TPA: hypothetical protein PLU43_03805 [Lachnospiraceae bacterium]|nr:hypothetical protein [Lachnospiraceae bacterium]
MFRKNLVSLQLRKKIALALMAISLSSVLLYGCGSSSADDSTSEETTVETTDETTDETEAADETEATDGEAPDGEAPEGEAPEGGEQGEKPADAPEKPADDASTETAE